MRPGKRTLLLAAIVIAAVCVRLGMWQLDRLAEKRAFNRMVEQRFAQAPLSHSRVPVDSAGQHFRRVVISGMYDFTHEFVLTHRARNGAPGVHVMTPLRVPGADKAVLVNRGWAYAPDAMSVDLAQLREPSAVNALGYIETFPAQDGGAANLRRNRTRTLSLASIRATLPYPILDYYVVLLDTAESPRGAPPPAPGIREIATDSVPASVRAPLRLTRPRLSDGSHLSYAVQWFSFAAISLIGTLLLIRRR